MITECHRLTDLQSAPRALARRGRELIVGLGRVIKFIDADHLDAQPASGRLSSLVNQIHADPTTPVIVFEVSWHVGEHFIF